MEILLQLGANKTAFIQFFVFVISITFLTVAVFNPYFKAYDQRLKQTKGADQVAIETQEEAKKLEGIYQNRAREINNKIKDIFEISRKQASESANIILTQAKTKTAERTEEARREIETQRILAEKDIPSISRDVASEISKKIMGEA